MGKFSKVGKIGNAVLAAVLAFSLTLPAPALAWAAAGDGAGLAAASLVPGEAPTGDVNADVWDGSVDVSWYLADPAAREFTLSKPAQLAGLAALVNGTAEGVEGPLTFRGVTIKLANDIWLNATAATGRDTTGTQRSWTPIGDLELRAVEESVDGGTMPRYRDDNCFDGTFDGRGHVVKNLYIYNNAEGTYGGVQALFATVGGHALIENTGVDGGWVYGRVAAGLVAISHAVPEVDDSGAKTCPMPRIIGCFNSANIKGNGSTTRGAAGIFAGEEQYRGTSETQRDENYHGAAYIANCYNTGTISAEAQSSNSAGGIAGTGNVQMFGCFNWGDVAIDSRYASALAGNLVGAGINVGQDSAIGFAGSSCVVDSFAREGSVLADDQGKVKLYCLMDAEHGKGQTGDRNPAVTGTDVAKFQAASWFADAASCKALSQSFVAGETMPRLFWQAGEERWDLNRVDAYGDAVYRVDPIAKQMFTGSPLTPAIKMHYTDEGGAVVNLHEGSDFVVAYADNTEVRDDAKATVTGLGRLAGERTVTFAITDGDLSKVSIAPVEAQWWFGPGTVAPAIEVTAPNGDVLKEGVDYELSIEGVPADAAGFGGADRVTATAKVTGVEGGKYAFPEGEQEKTLDFTVLKASTELAGAGTEADPYLIASKGDLQFLAWATSVDQWATWGGKFGADDAHFKVTADIDASSSDEACFADRPVDPLFSFWEEKDGKRAGGFGGTFDGDGHTITLGQTPGGLSLDLHEALGLFVYTKSGSAPTFENLTLAGSVTAPNGAAAGLLVMGQSGTITVRDCVNKAAVQGDQYYYGAAAGFIMQTSNVAEGELVMEGCTNEGAVTSATRAAGLVANLGGKKATFKDCANEGAVTAGSLAGGFVAIVLGASTADAAFGNVAFARCANAGAVTVTSSGDAGGFVGRNQERVLGIEFSRCANTGAVTFRGPGNAGAGFVGRAYSPATFVNCYNNATIAGEGYGALAPAGIVGYANALTRTGEDYARFVDAAGEKAGCSFRMENVYNAGGFGGRGSDAGGLVGTLYLHQELEFDNVYFRGGTDAAGKAIADNKGESWSFAVNPPIVRGDAAQMDEAAMKEPTFASLLGAAFAAAGEGVNGGFPVLVASGAEVQVIDLGTCTVTGAETLDYTGADIALDDLVVKSAAGEKLVEGVDYVVFYSAEGTKGLAIVQGIGSCTGTVEHEFEIKPCALKDCRISPVKSVNYADFAGAGATQQVTLLNPAGRAMVEGVDYEVLYANNTAVGTGYLMARGKGPRYAGTLLRLFTIEPGDLSRVQVGGLESHYAYAGSSGLWVFEQLTAANGHELERADWYSADKAEKGDYVRVFYAFNEATGKCDAPVWANGDASQGWATHLTKAGRYRVELRGDGFDTVRKDSWTNGCWTGTASAEFTYGNRMESDEDVAIAGVAESFGQTGGDLREQIAPELVNRNTGFALVEGEDYTLSFKRFDEEAGAFAAVDEVVEPGDYQLVITGTGSWFGTRELAFTVVPARYFINDDAQVAGINASYFATGQAIKPVPTSVKIGVTGIGTFALEAGEDYEVSYVDADGNAVDAPTEAGTYYAVIAGAGDYRGAKRVKFDIEKPFIKVFVKKGAGKAQLAKQYTKDEFKALKSAKAAANPVSALYCDEAGSNWTVASTNDYVTLGDLFKDAGVTWASGASVSYAAGDFGGRTFTFDEIGKLMFYPATRASETDAFGGRKAPFVLALSSFSSKVGKNWTSSAAETEEFNLGNADATNMPRAIMGVTAGDYANAWKNSANMRGNRLVKGVDSITVTLPASTMTAKAASATLNVTAGKAATFAASKVFKVSGAKGAVTYQKKSGNAKIVVNAKNGKVTVPKTLKAGTYKVVVAVKDAGKGAWQPVSRNVTFTVKVAKAKKR